MFGCSLAAAQFTHIVHGYIIVTRESIRYRPQQNKSQHNLMHVLWDILHVYIHIILRQHYTIYISFLFRWLSHLASIVLFITAYWQGFLWLVIAIGIVKGNVKGVKLDDSCIYTVFVSTINEKNIMCLSVNSCTTYLNKGLTSNTHQWGKLDRCFKLNKLQDNSLAPLCRE